jgi:hypothetical protein
MVYFQTKNANLGKFWWTLVWKMFYGHLVYSLAIGNGNVVAIWYISPVLVYCVKKYLATLNQLRVFNSFQGVNFTMGGHFAFLRLTP